MKSRSVAIGCVLVAALSACGGSGSSKPSSSGSPTTTGASNPDGGKSSGKTAPDALVLAKIIAATDVKNVQDNGGFAAQNGFQSMATVTTAHGKVTAETLYSYDSVADATSGYSLFIPNSDVAPVALSGVGDKAVSLSDEIIVRKGAQVLQLNVQPNKAVEDQLDNAKKNGTGVSDALIKSAEALPRSELLATAKAVAAKLTGDTGSTDLTYLPAGAFDPCGIDNSKLESGDIKVTSAPTFSEDPPMSECVYTFTGTTSREPGTGSLSVETLTAAQGAAAAPPITPAQQYASTLKSFTSRGGYAATTPAGAAATFGADTIGPLNVAGMKTGEVGFAALAKLPESDDGHIIIRISSFRSSYVVDREHCYKEISHMLNELIVANNVDFSVLGPAGAAAAKDQLEQDIAHWCDAEERSGKVAHGSNG